MLPDLTSSAIYAGVYIARRMTLTGGSPKDSISYLVNGEAFVFGLNYAEASLTADSLGWDVFDHSNHDGTAFRATIQKIAERGQPYWMKLAHLGRSKVLDLVNDETRQCFSIAELDSIDETSVSWWNDLDSLSRAYSNRRKLARGRMAERRTFEREGAMLSNTNLVPSWVSIDDNSAGFDIKSWRQDATGLTWSPHFIEVKSSVTSERLFISRHEWAFAIKNTDNWELQYWHESREEPLVFEVCDLEPRIPVDTEFSRWENCCVDIGDLVGPDEKQ